MWQSSCSKKLYSKKRANIVVNSYLIAGAGLPSTLESIVFATEVWQCWLHSLAKK
jgi:hypothetical protein